MGSNLYLWFIRCVIILGCGLFYSYLACAQQFTQTIQGRIVEKSTGLPLPGVNVIITHNDYTNGTITDPDGYFVFTNQPIGKYSIKVSFIGYETYLESDMNLLSGRSLMVNIQLKESVRELAEVSVKAHERKNEALNSMASIGVRSFTLEETNRYAGAYGDPARMAMNYAGVLPARDNRNDIIIRGNSSNGLQWRLNDIEIPNPNHFGASATTGGPITMVNANLLAKSDFFTGAFPAEYGNAIAGIFDLKLKASNLQKNENWVEIGWNGLEYGAEGPFVKGKEASCLFAIRYGLTNLANLLGADFKNEIYYKDFTFRLNFPGTKTGNWSILGMGGNSQIILDETKYDASERMFDSYGESTDNSAYMALLGVSHKVFPFTNSKLTSTLSATLSGVQNHIDTFTVAEMNPFLWGYENTQEIKYSGSSRFDYKLNKRTNLATGINYDLYDLSYNDKEWYGYTYRVFTDTSHAYTQMLRAYAEAKYLLGARWETYLGCHTQFYLTNGSYSIEPRASLKFNINDKLDVSYGFGMHSQMQPQVMYYVLTPTTTSGSDLSNANLGFTKNIHNNIAFHWLVTDLVNIKLEAYYQYLYQLPVKESEPAYSLINFGTEYYVEREDSLVNEGTGQNYGLELTVERYLKNNFFYLLSGSVFKSEFTSIDGVTRSTAFDGRFAVNALGGYEIEFPKKHVALILGARITYAGGRPYVPYDQEATVATGKVIYNWDRAYTLRREDYRRFSLRIGFRRNKERYSLETSIDFQYRTKYTSIYLERIDVTTGEIVNLDQLGFYPMINTRISF